MVLDHAFFRHDPDRSGFIDSEVVAEVMRDLGIEPELGEVLGQPGAMLFYGDVEKMMIYNAHRWYTDGTLPPFGASCASSCGSRILRLRICWRSMVLRLSDIVQEGRVVHRGSEG